jgi:hypothetical protein
MFRLVSRVALRFWLLALAVLTGVAVGVAVWLRQLQRTWGVAPGDAERAMPGDDLVPDANIIETRSLAIDAAPAAVWPWLVQMGYGRAGWYSYDRIDMEGHSAADIQPELQELAEGDVVPTHPGGGFIARLVEPEAALVLYLDSELVDEQMKSAIAQDGAQALDDPEEEPAGLQMAGAFGDMAMPEFRASWAFSLEPADGGTRLIERMRLWTAEAGLPQRLGLPMMGFGVFAMTRKHMLGVKERAERPSTNGAAAAPESTVA